MGLLSVRPEGVYCEQADIYVDPWRPVPRAVVTHAHSDHARRGSGKYLVADEGLTLARLRLGHDAAIDPLAYGQTVTLNGVQLALHPAGHMRGSAQVRLEYQGQVAVVTGDFKTQVDPTCRAWEPQRCHQLVIESTFALPIYRWDEPVEVIRELIAWWQSNQAGGKTSVLYCYAIGKAQRILGMLRQCEPLPGPIYVHGAIHQGNLAYEESGCALADTHTVRDAAPVTPWNQALILAVPSAHGSRWLRRFGHLSTAMASGWMRIRGTRRRRSLDRGFVLSDHADWTGLLEAVQFSDAESVWVTHGQAETLARYLSERGHAAQALRTPYRGEWQEAENDEAADTDAESSELKDQGQIEPTDAPDNSHAEPDV